MSKMSFHSIKCFLQLLNGGHCKKKKNTFIFFCNDHWLRRNLCEAPKKTLLLLSLSLSEWSLYLPVRNTKSLYLLSLSLSLNPTSIIKLSMWIIINQWSICWKEGTVISFVLMQLKQIIKCRSYYSFFIRLMYAMLKQKDYKLCQGTLKTF